MTASTVSDQTIPSTHDGATRSRAPALTVIASVLVAMFGFHWDIAWHADFIRDRFLTVPHLVILAGLAGALVAAWLRARQHGERIIEAARHDRGAMLSLIAVLATAMALNVDNWWHILFGFDLTLWSPPHLVLSLGFLCLLLGGLREAALLGLDRRLQAAVPGFMFATATLLVFEYELGFLHYDMQWEPIALALFTGATLSIAAGVSRLMWAGTIAGAGAIAARLVGLAINAALGAPLPFPPPVGIVLAGVTFDLVRRSATLRDRPQAVVNGLALTAASVVMTATTAAARFAFGRTWWSAPVVVVGMTVGLLACLAGAWLGTRASRFVTASDAAPPRRSRWQAYAKGAVAGVAGTAIIGASGLAVLDTTSPNYLQATLARDDDTVTLTVDGATSRDWTTLIGGHSDRPGRTTWLTSMHQSGETFTADVPTDDLTWLGVWFQGANRAWVNPRVLDTTGPIVLERDAFRTRDSPPINSADVVISYVLFLLLVTGQIGYIAMSQPRRSRPRGAS